VLDVGCGTGETCKFFQALGIDTLGVDGLPENVERCPQPAMVYDFCSDKKLEIKKFDLVWCCEVVEHIAEEHVEKLIDVLTSGKWLAMTHAVPGQSGHHHVNCQPKEYWIEKITARGFVFDDVQTNICRALLPNGRNYFKRTGLIFHE